MRKSEVAKIKKLKPGLYENLITADFRKPIEVADETLIVKTDALRDAEAPDRLSIHIGNLVSQLIKSLPEKDRATRGAELANSLVHLIEGLQPTLNAKRDELSLPAELLTGILARLPDGTTKQISAPEIPLLDTTLLSNAPGEPRVGNQLNSEIDSADSIDVLMAFVRMSGLRQLQKALVEHCGQGKSLRVLTTTYTKSTEPKALDWLKSIGADVRVSYDTSTTRLHAKAWIFQRDSGLSTAYIGSSNLTYSAQVDGLEWNVRLSAARNPDVVGKMDALFETTWQSDDFEDYDADKFLEAVTHEAPTTTHRLLLSPFEFKPKPFQERLLEQIRLARTKGRHENLLVSATGTGKTVMAALDYARLCKTLPSARLLFIAHRQEILEQSLSTFCHGLRDQNFGELWVGKHRPSQFDHVFASIQTLNNADLSLIEATHFDVVIIDEFHHAAAKSYERILNHLKPKELLGLTATPERADGLPVLQWFGGEIAAELRLWDAIEQHQLSPFSYYGVHDGYDLQQVPWKRGSGYDVEGLTNVYTANDRLAHGLIKAIHDRVDDVGMMSALGFCVSVDHARYLERIFSDTGLPSLAVSGNTPPAERSKALQLLRDGEIRVLFSVDLFNEGVDLPMVDTLLLMRPTNSATLFLQQLGRGLRKATDKRICTILDFVGMHRREFRFDIKFRALLGGSRTDIEKQIQKRFPFLPAGCHMELDGKSQQEILTSIKNAIPRRKDAKVSELKALTAGGRDISLSTYLTESGLELEDVYTTNSSWMDLRSSAGLVTHKPGPHEKSIQRALSRILHIDDGERLEVLERFGRADFIEVPSTDARETRLLRMFAASTLPQSALGADISLVSAFEILRLHPSLRRDLPEIAEVLRTRIDHEHFQLTDAHEIPLNVHAKYSRTEIQCALGDRRHPVFPSTWREGVRWFPDEQIDALAFTLDKTTGGFSPTTRYKDFAISPDLIRWESQSTTAADSPTGKRYQEHIGRGSRIFLFTRVRNDARWFWFLGTATYVNHHSERPMQITWRLDVPLSGDLFSQFRAAV